jgi:hypothetical protein
MSSALAKDRFVRGVPVPTLPEKDTFPAVPAARVSDVAPFIVFVKLMLAPVALTVLNVGVFVSTTGPVIVIDPSLVVIFPCTLIALVLVAPKLASAVTPPIEFENVILPAPACTLRVWLPLIVLLKLVFAPLDVITLLPVMITGFANERGLAPDTVMFAPI